MREIILRNLIRRKARTLLTILGIMIGIGLIVVLVSITEGIAAETAEALGRVQTINVSSYKLISPIPYSYVEEIEQISGVKVASPLVTSPAMSVEGVEILERRQLPILIQGRDPEKMKLSPTARIPKSIVRGRFLMPEDRYSAVIGKSIADEFHKSYRSKIDVNGVLFKVVGIYETGMEAMDSSMIIPLEVAQEMLGMGEGLIHTITVDVEDPKAIGKVAERIEYSLKDVLATTPEEIASELSGIQSTMSTATWVVASVAAIVGGIGVVNSMVMNVMERRREIGILKAVGWTKGEILRSFLLESILMGFLGGIAGVLLGVLGTAIIGGLFPIVPCKITPTLILEVMIFAIVLGGLGGLYPAWRAATVDPIEALRYA